MLTAMTLTFGIYPGGQITVDPQMQGPPDDPDKITAALDELGVTLVRGYVHYPQPEVPIHGVTDRRRLDLVTCFRSHEPDLTDWLAFLRSLLHRHGPRLACLQITEEPNQSGPGGDGGSPVVRDALVAGVIEARREARRLGLDVRVGCNATLDFDPAQEFWTDLGRRGGDEFRASLDYAGLDFFPDVFHPIAADRLESVVTAALTAFRTQSLAAAGIPESTPIHIAEHGWGTGPGRPDDRQASVVSLIVELVAAHADRLNIDTYEHFALRDADSANPDPIFQLGLLRSDYSPKPAFKTYQTLISKFQFPGTPMEPRP
jgi:hypothetical protein